MQALHEHIAKDGFRLRGTHMSRLDAFSDIVFGFAITLIVVSLEVPRTYNELHALLAGFPAFAICFLFIFSLWWAHFRFFRRYGLHDAGTISLNCLLLFMVLFYVYPLKFLFTLFIGQLLGHESANVFSNDYQIRELMLIYGTGFMAVYVLFAALYWNAWRQRLHLRLNPLERTLTISSIWNYAGLSCIGLLCIVLAYALPLRIAGYAGYIFWLVGIWKFIHGSVAGRYIRAARVELTAEDRAELPHSI
jgi:uncharacterized membrane protein